jgi:hypothetical protein
MFFTYNDTGVVGDPNRYSGSLAAYLTTYLSYPPPTSLMRTAVVAMCPAQIKALPNIAPVPPLGVPVSYFSTSVITNDPPAGSDLVIYPFGRPNSPFAPNKKISAIRRTSDSWAMTDCDRQLLLSMGITAASYQNYVPALPVHSPAQPASRQYLFYDFSVRSVRTPK